MANVDADSYDEQWRTSMRLGSIGDPERGNLKRRMMKYAGSILGTVAMLLLLACGDDSGTGTVTPPPTPDVEQDTKPPKTPMPMPCQVSIKSPVEDKHVTSLMTIEAEASHLFLGMNRAEAALVPLFESVPAVDSVLIGAKNVDAWTDGKSFDWEFDVSNLPTGEWSLVVNAWADPNPEYPGQAQGLCETRRTIFVDNACPSDELIAPLNSEDGGNYFQTMPVQVDLDDNTGVQSAHLENESGTVLHEFVLTDDGQGVQSLQTVLDVCDYGTGVEKFHLVVTDDLGNSCSHELTPNIIRCPRLARVHTVDATDELTLHRLGVHDEDGDARKDIIAPSNLGIAVLRNNENGFLEDPVLVPEIQGPLSMVTPLDLNDDGKSDYVVLGNTGGVAVVRVGEAHRLQPRHGWRHLARELRG